MEVNWLWDTRFCEREVKIILKDENNPRFFIYAEKLFSRIRDPKIAFSYISEEIFYKQWPLIKQRINKDVWNRWRADFWESIYKKVKKQCPNGAHHSIN